MKDLHTSLMFDMRAPEWGAPATDLYTAALEMAAFADRIGVDRIVLMEHHGSEDNYLPQPFLLASAMAAVTSRIRFLIGAVILPLHDPVEVAEQIAITDLLTNGRLSVVFGAGYVPSEFAMFGKSPKDRARLMDTGIETILRALSGERFVVDGRPVYVRPLPVQRPESIVMVGGGVTAAARRAARFGVGFGPVSADLIPVYEQECRAAGREPGDYFTPALPLGIHLCEDPEQGWATIERHAVHVITEYAKWSEQEGDGSTSPFRGLTDPAVLRAAGLFGAWTPEELIARVPGLEHRSGFGFYPLLGGLSPEEGWKSLRLLEQTMPDLRAAMAAA